MNIVLGTVLLNHVHKTSVYAHTSGFN